MDYRGKRIKINSGEYAGKTGRCESVIPMRYRKEETTYRVQVDGFPILGGWNGKILLTEK